MLHDLPQPLADDRVIIDDQHPPYGALASVRSSLKFDIPIQVPVRIFPIPP